MKTTLCNNISGTNRMRLVRSFSLFLLGVVLACCPACNQAPEKVTEGKIIIKGSNTLGEELVPGLIAEYKKEHPAVTFELESKGTASGFAAMVAGQCDIAAASRVASGDELKTAHARGIDLNVHMVGSYSVAVIVNAASGITNLTRDQVRDLFAGVVQDWKEVGGVDAPVHAYIRDPISGTYLGFRELAMEDKPYGTGAKTFTNYTAIVQAVAQDPNGIGYSSIDLASKTGVKPVSIRGVSPSVLSVNEGQYPCSRSLRLYTNKAKESAAARDFVRFVQSSRGQEILDEMGFVPRP
ncbi:MAG: phosphate-binding protein [Pedosphaera sp.]|nr:phosphate-binding protein [Pedosphaera sp.]